MRRKQEILGGRSRCREILDRRYLIRIRPYGNHDQCRCAQGLGDFPFITSRLSPCTTEFRTRLTPQYNEAPRLREPVIRRPDSGFDERTKLLIRNLTTQFADAAPLAQRLQDLRSGSPLEKTPCAGANSDARCRRWRR